MPQKVIIANDANAAPGWVKKVLLDTFDISEEEATSLTMEIVGSGHADITHLTNSPVQTAMHLAEAGLNVTIQQVAS